MVSNKIIIIMIVISLLLLTVSMIINSTANHGVVYEKIYTQTEQSQNGVLSLVINPSGAADEKN